MFYLSRSITPFSDSKKNLASVTLNIITIGLIHPLCKQFPITAFSLLYLPTPILSMHMHASLPAWVLISHTVPLHIVMPSLLCADLNTLCQITMIPFHSQNCTDANFTWPHLMPLKLVFFFFRKNSRWSFAFEDFFQFFSPNVISWRLRCWIGSPA